MLAGLQKQANQLNVASHINFIGQVPASQMAGYYEKAIMCVIPSLFETFSMVACEAMLHSLPIVASRHGSLPELVIDGETGLLMEPTNSESIAADVLHLLNNPGEARDMGQKGFYRVQQLYCLDNYLQNLEKVVKSAQMPKVNINKN